MKPRSELATVLLLAAIVAGMLVVRESDGDTWWHMALGRWIVEHHGLPEHDPFAFTVPPDKHYLVDSWLFGPISYWLYEGFGINGLIAMKALAAAGIFLAMFARSRIHERRHPLLVAAFFVAVMFVVRSRLVARPHTLGLLMVAMYLLMLELAIHRRAVWLVGLAVVQILWTNLHPSFFLGLVIPSIYVGAMVLEWIALDKITWKEPPPLPIVPAQGATPRSSDARVEGPATLPYARLKSLPAFKPSLAYRPRVILGACVTAGLACLVNPDGIGRPVYIFHMFLDKQLYEVREYMPFTLPDYLGPRGLFLLLAVVTFTAAIWRRRFAWVGLQVAFGYIGLTSARFFYEMLAVFTPTCPALLMDGFGRLIAGPLRYFERRPAAARMSAAGFAVLLLLACVGLDPDWGLGLRPNNDLPIAATDFLEREQVLEKTGGRLFNTYNVGGYLIWRLAPRHQVFIDSRIHLFYGQFFDDYMALPDAKRHDLWESYIRKYNITVAVVRHPMFGGDGRLYNSTAPMFNRNEWALVDFDDAAIVYVRRVPQAADIIARHEYRYFDPQILDASYLMQFTQRDADIAGLRSEMDRAMVDHPRSYRLLFLRAYLNQVFGLPREAEQDLRRALEINPALDQARQILRQEYGKSVD